MRPTITAAQLPFHRVNQDSLDDQLGRFNEAFKVHRRAPSAAKIAAQACQISDIYNQLSERSSAGREDLLDARAHFFMPTDLVKVWGPLGELVPFLDLARRNNLSLLDLGGGTGTATAGCAMLLKAAGFTGHLTSTLVEPDRTVGKVQHKTFQALEDAGIGTLAWQQAEIDVETFLRTTRKKRYDLVVSLNLLSEMFPAEEYVSGVSNLVERLVDRVATRRGFVVVVEPALQRYARLLAQAGLQLVSKQRSLFAPCRPDICPYLEKSGGFCFHSRKVLMTPLLQRVVARCGLSRNEVNYSYLTLSAEGRRLEPPQAQEGEITGRIISYPKRVKKGFNYYVCTSAGLLVAFAPRRLPSDIKGGRLVHGTLVRVTGA